mgnify:CR=1 FL=1
MIGAATLCVQAATLCVAGALAGQQGKPDLPSAAFHLLVAAAAGDARALRDLRCLAQVWRALLLQSRLEWPHAMC